MDDTLASTPSPYTGLRVRSADLFPLTCNRCGQSFKALADFLAQTTAVFQSSGLMEREDAGGDTFVLLLRNCPCGTSLALRCHDRRDHTKSGELRRRRYVILVDMLIEGGAAPDQARGEARRLLREVA